MDVAFIFFFFFGKAIAAFGINLCKVYMNDDPKIYLTYIMAKQGCGKVTKNNLSKDKLTKESYLS